MRSTTKAMGISIDRNICGHMIVGATTLNRGDLLRDTDGKLEAIEVISYGKMFGPSERCIYFCFVTTTSGRVYTGEDAAEAWVGAPVAPFHVRASDFVPLTPLKKEVAA